MNDLEARLRQAAQQLDAASARYQAEQPSPMTRRSDVTEPTNVRSLTRPRWSTRSVLSSSAAGLMVAAATLAVIVLARRQGAPVNETVPGAPSFSGAAGTTTTVYFTADIKADEVTSGMSLSSLANGRYLIDTSGPVVVEFTNGRATAPDGSTYRLQLGEIADIDTDGLSDAAVIVTRSNDGAAVSSWLLFVELNNRGAAEINAHTVLGGAMGVYATTDGQRIRVQRARTDRCPEAEMQWWTVGDTVLQPTGDSSCVASIAVTDSLTTKEFTFVPGTDVGIATFSDLSGRATFAASANQQLHLTVRYNSASRPGQEVFVVINGQRLGSALPGRPLDLMLPATGSYELEVPRIDASLGDRPLTAELSIR
jgi:hypothetical protein